MLGCCLWVSFPSMAAYGKSNGYACWCNCPVSIEAKQLSWKLIQNNCVFQIEKYIAKKKADTLRKQQQVYDEFSPNGPVSDHEPYLYNDGQAYLGRDKLMVNAELKIF